MATILDTTRPVGGTRSGHLARPKTISVNGTVVPRAAIARETQNHPASKPIDAWMAAARALVVRELLLQEAQRLDLVPEPIMDEQGRRETDDEALVRQLIEREITTPEPDEDICRRIYERNRSRFRSSDLHAVRHILVPAAPQDAARRAEAKADAEAILAEIIVHPSRFATLATAHSACPSATQGGNLGQVSRGQTVPEFESALDGLDGPGLIETRFGFHVVMVDQRVPGRELPFEIVRDRIATWLVARARHTASRQFIAMLASRAEIAGIDLGADRPPSREGAS
jgi:peptidyl-prolyl cis-trans isomerase C